MPADYVKTLIYDAKYAGKAVVAGSRKEPKIPARYSYENSDDLAVKRFFRPRHAYGVESVTDEGWVGLRSFAAIWKGTSSSLPRISTPLWD